MTAGRTTLDRTDLRGFAQADLDGHELVARLSHAVAAARSGRPVVYPTETVYGVGSGLSAEGVRAVRAAKRRAEDAPLLALVDGVDAVPDLEWTEEARALAGTFWPGALTLVLRDPGASFPPGVRGPAGTVAIRHTPHPVAASLVRALGGPLTSSSANLPGQPPATDAASAAAFAAGLEHAHLVDVGTLPPSAPSTIVDCSVSPPRLLREGAVPAGRLGCLLPEIR